MTELRALSLFTGIGGLDLAAEAAGIRTVAMCERDPYCRRVLMKRWPHVPVFEDIKKLRGEDIETAIDLIHGGFPCQSFSVAGKQKGKDDDRYLWPEFSRLVGEIGPRWVVAENVPGIVPIAADDVCADLERQGYCVGIWHFEAAAVGAFHRRARIFFVAHSESAGPGSRFLRRDRNHETNNEWTDHPASGPGESSYALSHSGCRMREGGAISGTFCGERARGPLIDAERPDRPFMADTEGQRRYIEQYIKDNPQRNNSSIGEIHTPDGPGLPRGDVSDSQSVRRRQGAEDAGWTGERSEQRAWDSPPLSRPDVSYSDDTWQLQQDRIIRELRGRTGDFCETLSDAERHEDREQQPNIAEDGERETYGSTERSGQRSLESELGGVAHGLPQWLDGYWRTEPDIPRVAARKIKDRVNRLRALGNAVVPAQVYPIFLAIMEIENGKYDCPNVLK